MKGPIIIAASLILSLKGFAQQKEIKDFNIPFELTSSNNIRVKVVLNSIDTLKLMLHTASSDISITEDGTAKTKSLIFNRTDTVTSWGSQQNTSRFSAKNKLDINGLKLENIQLWENKNTGPETDGKFGLNLFTDQFVSIDFEKNIIQITESLPKDLEHYQKFPLVVKDDSMFLNAVCVIGNDTLDNQYLIHTGYGGTMLLDDDFSNKYKLNEQLKVISERDLKDSYGNTIKTRKAILPKFLLGKFELNQIPVSFFEGSVGRQKMSVIGGDLIKRFNLIIDKDRKFVYIKPNKLNKAKYSTI
ncbi:hypothetical protein [Pedobacter aquatilis]|uniref:hypothetical protein n=1 Tax=Pedobacter aquatilis TaxID=351343 RepID=UPI0029307C53|nr:hypothetical protein [Pedobacter aquatilis]